MTTRPAGNRLLWIVTGLLAVAALALWGSSKLTWPRQPGALVPLALVSLAGIAGVLATSGWARRAVGVLLALTALAAGWSAFGDVFELGGALPARGVAGLAVLALLAAGVLLVRGGHRMPRLGAGYATPAAAKGNETPERELWRALSEGKDPTVG
jgi:hypothetical protein